MPREMPLYSNAQLDASKTRFRGGKSLNFYSDFSVIPLVDSLSLSIQEYPLKTNFAQRKYPSPAEYAIQHHRRSSDKETSA